MKSIHFLLAAALCSAASAEPAASGLTSANYVEVGDTIVDMLDTSALAFSTMLLGTSGAPHPMLASFATPSARVQPFSAPCPGGGSVSGSIRDRDASGDVSVHDRFVTEFDHCGIDKEVFSGSSEFEITAHRVEQEVETTELAFRFHHLGSDAMRWTGSASAVLKTDLKTGSEHYAVTYRDMDVTRNAQSYRWRFTLEMRRPPLGDHTAQINGALLLDHVVLRLAQDEQFVLAPGGRPRSGQLTATDAQGDRLLVEAASRRYRYRFYDHANRGESPNSSSQSRLRGSP
jgi:hypothetical protein